MRRDSVVSLISTEYAVCNMCYGEWVCRYVPPERVRSLRRFGLKTVKDFTHFGLESSIVFEGATVVYGHICRLVLNE